LLKVKTTFVRCQGEGEEILKNTQFFWGWLLVTGYWLLVAGYWLLVTGCWLLVAGYWLLVTGLSSEAFLFQ
jgi:hypothetical protein